VSFLERPSGFRPFDKPSLVAVVRVVVLKVVFEVVVALAVLG
jgi:hypothetical protein